MTEPRLADLSLSELASALRNGRTTARRLTEQAIANHDGSDASLGAYKTWSPDKALDQADAADAAMRAGVFLGPLQGLPVSIKDLYGVAGYPTFAGAPRELPLKWELEGPVVDTVRQNLAVVTGKTHTVEFAFGGIGSNPHWGTPRNPWDTRDHRVPGGSSAGAGVSLQAGSAVLALGSDTAGSVRIPAAMTGTVGLKTSAGRWSTEGIVPLSPTLDTAGVLARSVADAAIGFAVIDPLVEEPAEVFLAELDRLDLSGVRIGICDWFFDGCDPGVAEAVRTAIDELASEGANVRRIDLPEVPECAEIFARGGLAAAEFAAFVNSEMEPFKATLDPNVRARFDRMEAITAVDYLTRRWRLEELAASVETSMDDVDVVLTPTVPITPPRLADLAAAEAYNRANMAALRNTAAANLLRLCALSMPVGRDAAGMPVGLQVMAPFGEDERLLAVALAFEHSLGTGRQRLGLPPLLTR